MAPYDILGNVVLVKFDYGSSLVSKKRFANQLLKTHKSVTTVLEKTAKIKGRLRTPTTKWIGGVKTKEVLYRENGCEFRFNIDTCYFSPRLSSERKEVADLVKKGERVLVMFGGAGPFAVTIGKLRKASEVISVELGREPHKYAIENVRRNKLVGLISCIQGDVRKKVPLIAGSFDRIVMARPNLADSFLDVAFKKIKKGGLIHYYGFYLEAELGVLKMLVLEEAKKMKRKVRIMAIKEAGDIGVKKYRYRVDIKVIN